MEGRPTGRSEHVGPGGNFSAELMAYAFRWYVLNMDVASQTHMFMDTDRPVQPDQRDARRLFAQDVLGMVATRDHAHWLAIRAIGGVSWLLDSLSRPRVLSFEEYLGRLSQWRNAFLVRADLLLPARATGALAEQTSSGAGESLARTRSSEVLLPAVPSPSAAPLPGTSAGQVAEGTHATTEVEPPGSANDARAPRPRLSGHLRRYPGGSSASQRR